MGVEGSDCANVQARNLQTAALLHISVIEEAGSSADYDADNPIGDSDDELPAHAPQSFRDQI